MKTQSHISYILFLISIVIVLFGVFVYFPLHSKRYVMFEGNLMYYVPESDISDVYVSTLWRGIPMKNSKGEKVCVNPNQLVDAFKHNMEITYPFEVKPGVICGDDTLMKYIPKGAK